MADGNQSKAFIVQWDREGYFQTYQIKRGKYSKKSTFVKQWTVSLAVAIRLLLSFLQSPEALPAI